MPPYMVAEISCNHGGDFDKATKLILSAVMAGADAVKLQTYTPAELTTPEHKDLWALYEKAQTPRDWHKELFEYAKFVGITIFSSAFSVDGVRFLQELGSPAIKIASAEFGGYHQLSVEEKSSGLVGRACRAARSSGVPLIVSTGRASLEDICSFRSEPSMTIFLHCVADYPSKIENANLGAIAKLQAYSENVGLSDHTPGYETAIAATALGAVMIEKHLKLDDDCIDAAYSLNPQQFSDMCKACRAIWKGMGDGVIRPTGQPRLR
jgi:sialic acid synthase SpsE